MVSEALRLLDEGTRLVESGSSFINAAQLEALPTLSADEVDALDIGVIRVDDLDVIQLYNKTEGRFTGYDPERLIGKNFFNELAPCTATTPFLGVFTQGLTRGELNTLFPYTFTYRMRATNVLIHLYRCPATSTNWVLVKPL